MTDRIRYSVIVRDGADDLHVQFKRARDADHARELAMRAVKENISADAKDAHMRARRLAWINTEFVFHGWVRQAP